MALFHPLQISIIHTLFHDDDAHDHRDRVASSCPNVYFSFFQLLHYEAFSTSIYSSQFNLKSFVNALPRFILSSTQIISG